MSISEKTFFLDQHGCAKNQVDAEIIISRLLSKGMQMTDDASKADVIIINSCGFIESAKQEALDSFMDARQNYPDAKVILAGCLAERYADVFSKELPEADGIFGNGDLSLIDSTVESVLEGKRTVVKAPQQGVCCGERKKLLSFAGSAFVKITEGCNNNCSFCAIPIIRGNLRSRPCSDIVEEIRSLVANGIKEINLIGQDLAAYGCGLKDNVFGTGENWYECIYKNQNKPIIETLNFNSGKKSPLCELVEHISKIEGNFWIRLLYIHPDHFNPDVLEAMKKDNRFLPYFDIPFQSGDDKIITAMNRTGSSTSYAKLVSTIRDVFPESCIRTTFLTGFPGETDEAASNTLEFLGKIQSDWSGCFAYSREDDTPAANFKGKVSKKIAEKRAAALESLQGSITQERLKDRVGKTYDVLVEEIIENKDGTDEGLAIGRAWFEAPEVDGSVVIQYDLDDKNAVSQIVPGEMIKVRALSSSEFDIYGEWIGQ